MDIQSDQLTQVVDPDSLTGVKRVHNCVVAQINANVAESGAVVVERDNIPIPRW